MPATAPSTLALVAITVLGCATDFSVPQEAQVGCKSAADCPSGWTCNEKVGRCVKTENIDSDAPQFAAAVTVTPPVLRKGAVGTVTFESTEELSADPEVTVNAGADRLMTLDREASSGKRYVYTYKAAGDEPQATDCAVSATLTDKAGNKSSGVTGKNLRFDFVPAGATKIAVTGSPVLKLGKASVAFTVTEKLADDPVVKLATGEALGKAAGSEGLDYVYELNAVGEESEDLAGVALTIGLTDEAGNAAMVGSGDATIVFDFANPAISGDPVITPATAKEGGLVTVTFTATEELGADPVVMIGGTAMQKGAGGGASFTYTHIATEGDGEGEKPVTVRLKDVAGNESAIITLKQKVRFDFTPPSVVAPLLTPPRVRGGEAFSLSFTASEDLDASPVVQFSNGGDPAVAMVKSAQSGREYTYDGTGPVTGSSPFYTVTGTLVDGAGNQTTSGAGTVVIDNVPPSLTGIEVAPVGAKVGSTIRLLLTADETLHEAPAVTARSGASVISFTCLDPTPGKISYTYTYAVTGATPQGVYTVATMTLVDDALNSRDVTPTQTFSVDSTVPAIASGPTMSRSPAFYRAGDTVSVAFTTTEDLDATLPNVVLDTKPWKAMPCAAGSGVNDYTCALAAPLAGTETPTGVVGITIQLQDGAGNTGYASANATLDFTGPLVATSSASPDPARLGAVVSYRATVSEPVTNTPALVTTPALTWAGPTVSGLTYTWTHAATAGESGAYTAKLDQLCDTAGNCAANVAANMAGFTIDATAPAVTAHTVSPARVKAGQDVTVTLTAGEPLTGDPDVKLGTLAMSKTGQAGQQYTYRYRTVGAEGDGSRTVSVQMSDPAGNVGGVVFPETVELDFTSPSVATSTAGPSPAKLNAVVTYRVTVSEAITNTPVLSTTPALAWAGPVQTGQTFTWTHAVAAGESGTYTASLDQLCDLAGNCALGVSAGMSGFIIDAAAPAITAVSLTTSNAASPLARGGDVVTSVFRSNEDLPANPAVTLGGVAMAFQSKSGAGPWTYTYARTVAPASGDTDGVKTATVTATDAAGNVTVQDALSVTLDFTAPFVVPGSASAQLVPDYPATNPLPQVTAATNGTTVRVTFTLSEAVSPSPAVAMKTTGQALAYVSSAGALYVYQVKVAGAAAGQEITEQVEITAATPIADAAGNVPAGALAVTSFALDTKAPAAPDTSTANRIVYTRVPWGAQSSSGAKKFTLAGAAGALPADATHVIVYDSASPGPTSLVGSAPRRVDGGFDEFALNGADRSALYVAAADAAGNLSPTAPAHDVTWVATLGGKQAGSTLANPTVLETTAMFTPVVVQLPGISGEPSQAQIAAAATVDGSSAIRQAAMAWTKRSAGALVPVKRSSHSMTYDSVRGRVIVFGGFNDDLRTWEWDAATGIWTDATPTGSSPVSATGSPMVFDSVRGRAVLISQAAAKVQTWEWDGETWVDRTPSGTAPGKRESPAAAYDRTRNVIVFFGGKIGNPNQDDLWEWDCATGTWTQRAKAGNWPPARSTHGMAFDPVRGVTVMYGGGAETGTWEWNGLAWTNRTPSGTTPGLLADISLAYDAERKRIVLFSGHGAGSVDTWEFDGQAGTWADRTPGTLKPLERSSYGMAYDSGRARVVLFGGYAGDYLSDIWDWDGTARTWTDRSNSGGGPSARSSFASAWDSDRKRVILFGGWDGIGKNDTWEYNPVTGAWRSVTPTGAPSARGSSALVYDSVRKKAILFGGYDSTQRQDTWEYDPTAETWIDRAPATKPGARSGHAMAYDANRQRVVLFGGWPGPGETWEYNGSVTNTWTNRTPASSPPKRSTTAMAYDSTRKRVVMFGGHDSSDYNDVWEWDGTPVTGTWTNRTPAGAAPDARYWHAFAWDAGRRKFYMHGGYGNSTLYGYSDIWELDPMQTPWVWTDRTPVGISPGSRREHGLIYDTGRGVLAAFLGDSVTSYESDSWDFDTATGARPAALWSVPFGASGAPAGAVVSSATVLAYAGGKGYTTADAPAVVNGVYLSAWDSSGGAWMAPLQSNAAPSGTPAVLMATISGALVPGLFGDLAQTMRFMIAPTQSNGSSVTLGDVGVDYIEVTVKYRQ